MSRDKLSEYCEYVVLSRQLLGTEDEEAYVKFLRFCAEHLHKGDQVQAIWSDYQDQAK